MVFKPVNDFIFVKVFDLDNIKICDVQGNILHVIYFTDIIKCKIILMRVYINGKIF